MNVTPNTPRATIETATADGFVLLAPPACLMGARHAWTWERRDGTFAVQRCPCGAAKVEVWGGKSRRGAAGSCCRVRFAAAKGA